MQTWEMIKKLTENPEKKFIRKGDPLEISVDGLNYLRWKSGHDYINLDHEWEEVKTPVTWQEAFEAWTNDKGFTIEYEGATYVQKRYLKIGCLTVDEEKYYGFESGMFTEGKWYID